MGLITNLFVFMLISVMLMVGVVVTFSLATGAQNPLEILSKIEITFKSYTLMGLFLLAIIVVFGIFEFFKEKFLGYT